MKLKELKKSITDLSDEELAEVLETIRGDRERVREPKKKAKPSKSNVIELALKALDEEKVEKEHLLKLLDELEREPDE